MEILNIIIQFVLQLLTFIVIVDAFSSFFLPPDNKVREQLGRIVNPLLNPIRKIIPPINNLDFSPIVLIILIQVVEYLLLRLIS